MKQIWALFCQTWWLWSICLGVCGFMVIKVSYFFLVLLPMLLVVFVYFAYMRFDRDGKPRGL